MSYDTCEMFSCCSRPLSLQINVMTNRDMLLDFSRVVEVFKAENDFCVVPTLLPLNSVLSVDLLKWFGKFFRFQAHKSWLESVCHIQIQRQSHGVKSLQISETRSFIWPMWLCSLASTTCTCTVLHSPLPPPLWLHQPLSLRRHGHANSAAIVSDSDCDFD